MKITQKFPKIYKVFLIFSLIIVLFLIKNPLASATVEVAHQIESSPHGILIEYTSNHGYIKQDMPIWYTHVANALSTARERMLQNKSIERIPILISIPTDMFKIHPEKTQISLETDCNILELQPKCYKIHYVGETSYQNLITLVSFLPTLKKDGQVEVIDNITSYNQAHASELMNLNGINQYFNPIWTVDSRYLIYTVWQDGNISYSINDVEQGDRLNIQSSTEYPTNTPLLSLDSKFMFLPSFEGIVVYNLETKEEHEVILPDASKSPNFELKLSHDLSNNRLLIARDLNLFSNYELYEYDLTSFTLNKIASDMNSPDWGNDFNETSYVKNEKATSPDGTWEATIDGYADRRKISLKPLFDGIETRNEKSSDVVSSKKSTINIRPLIIIIVISFLGLFVILNKKKKSRFKIKDQIPRNNKNEV